MLTLYTPGGAVPLEVDDYYIKQLYSGLDELVFSISIYDDTYLQIQEESSIREESDYGPQNYLVKAIDGGAKTATIKCQIDLDDWKTTLNLDYDSGSDTIENIITAVAPTGWSVDDQTGLTTRRTISLEAATPLDVLEDIRTTWNVTFRFDCFNKVVTVVKPDRYTPVGAFMARDVNLQEVTYKGKSTGFATRLYAYGKDNMTFAGINGGKPYVDNNTYSSRVICAYWKDERYTIPANLLEDARTKLAELAVPARSYNCSVLDLASIDPVNYSWQDFSLFAVVSLVDTTRNAGKVDHQVVEVWHYPYAPQKNKITLSTAAPRIQSQTSQIINSLTNVNSVWQRSQVAAMQTAFDLITGGLGGYVVFNLNDAGQPQEILIMDADNITDAVNVIRMNKNGIAFSQSGYNGPFVSAWTIDGNFVANFITAGKIQSTNGLVYFDLDNNELACSTLVSASPNWLGTDKMTAKISPQGYHYVTGNGGSFVLQKYRNDTAVGEPMAFEIMDSSGGAITIPQGGCMIVTPDQRGYCGINAFTATLSAFGGGSGWKAAQVECAAGLTQAADSSVNLRATAVYVSGNLNVSQGLYVTGTKSRVIDADQYGDRLLYAYETTSPTFGDIGEGRIGEDGSCYIWLEPIFAKSIADTQYQVFLQNYGAGECYVSERKPGFFIVTGTPGLAFGWELKAKQAGYDQVRTGQRPAPALPDNALGEDAAEYINKLKGGRLP